MRRIAARLTYANVMSTIALFAALGGGAYAASKFVGPTGVVKLCVSNGGGVKVLAAKKTQCGKGATLVPVNQRGPAGQQGPPGASSSGGASTYSAGSGLTLSGNTFGADLTKLQARITGSGCAADQALQSVAQNGTPTCTGLHAYESPAVAVGLTSVGVGVPAGTWLLLGQAQANWTNSSTPTYEVVCTLQAGGQTVDSVNQTVATGDTGTLNPIGTVTTSGLSTSVTIGCSQDPKLAIGGNLAVIAIPLAALN